MMETVQRESTPMVLGQLAKGSLISLFPWSLLALGGRVYPETEVWYKSPMLDEQVLQALLLKMARLKKELAETEHQFQQAAQGRAPKLKSTPSKPKASSSVSRDQIRAHMKPGVKYYTPDLAKALNAPVGQVGDHLVRMKSDVKRVGRRTYMLVSNKKTK